MAYCLERPSKVLVNRWLPILYWEMRLFLVEETNWPHGDSPPEQAICLFESSKQAKKAADFLMTKQSRGYKEVRVAVYNPTLTVLIHDRYIQGK